MHDAVIASNDHAGIFSWVSGLPVQLTVDHSTIQGNEWGLYIGFSTATVTDTLILDNTQGGISSANGALTVTNSTLSGNGTGLDASLSSYMPANVVVQNATIVGNSMGLSRFGSVDGYEVGLTNTLIAANSTVNCSGGAPTSHGHNLESTNTCGFTIPGDLVNTDPMLGPLQDNGGQTLTYALFFGSPAIDAGDNTGAPTTDQRGMPRPRDGNGDGSAITDIGAFEYQPLLGDVNGDGSVNVQDVFYLINYLFAGGPAPVGPADVNADTQINVADVFYLINYLFAGGPAPV